MYRSTMLIIREIYGGMAASFNKLNHPTVLVSDVLKNRTYCSERSNLFVEVQFSSVLVHTERNKSSSTQFKMSGDSGTSAKRNRTPNALLNQTSTVGIIGGVSVFSTLIFLEKLVWRSSRNGEDCPPFVVCSDPKLTGLLPWHSAFRSFGVRRVIETDWNFKPIIENLRSKRMFLEKSGAHCIVMPCHVSHAWHDEISEGCSLPFLHAGDCVAGELREAKLKPLETGSNVRIGLIASHLILAAGFYQNKLQNQGFEVVLPDKGTMEHILIPAVEAIIRKDIEGARNLLRIAIQVLLVRAVNVVIVASDEFQGLLPHDDPLLKRCVDPTDALARATLKWAKLSGKMQNNIT